MDHDWLRDFFIQFLKSPKWIHPISEFIDNECFIFDNEEENKLAYTDSHNKFKALVDSLLTEHLRDVAVTEEHLENFCGDVEKDNESSDPELVNLIAEQLLSVDDFVKFRAMMTKRNLEQQMEALRDMQMSENGESGEEGDAEIWKSYEDELAEALMLSEKETENDCLEESELQKAIALSLAEIHKSADWNAHNGNVPESSAPPMSVHLSAKAEKKQRTMDELAPVQMRKPLMRETPVPTLSEATPAPTVNYSTSTPAPAPPPERREPTEEEKKMRAEYLKKQREKLLEKKRLEREKGMQEYDSLRAATRKQPPPPEVAVERVEISLPPASDPIVQNPEKTATQLRQALTLQLRQSLLASKGGS